MSMVKVVLLKGGWSNERNISLKSAMNVENILNEIGVQCVSFDLKQDNINDFIKILNKDIVIFNCLHGTYGEDGCIQGLFEILGVKYTHSGLLTSALMMNKSMAKEIIYDKLNINIPDGYIIKKSDLFKNNILMDKPYILKPVSEGSSNGIMFFEKEHNITEDNYNFCDVELMVEEYIEGIDITTAVLCGKSIGTMEIDYNNGVRKIYDIESKYSTDNEKMAKHIFPARIPQSIYNLTLEKSSAIYNLFNCKGVIRIDYRYSFKNNKLFFLEVNTHPGLTELSLVPGIARYSKVGINKLIRTILEDV